jgi:hypothetical protein
MFNRNFFGRVLFGILIITIIGAIFAITVIVKYEVMAPDYHQFLTDAYDYNNDILTSMDLLEKDGYLKEAIAVGEQYIDVNLINTYWHWDIFDWTENSFATPEILEKLNCWRKTGQIPQPKKSQTDYEKGLQSV